MTTGEKFEKVADAVYDKGRTDEWSDFWEGFQNGGTRTNYQYAFYYWEGATSIKPKYKIIPTSYVSNMFYACRRLKKIEAEYFDLSQANVGTSANTAANYANFAYCHQLEEIEDIGLPAGGYNQTFTNDYALRKIAVLRVTEECQISAPFTRCDALEDITIEGTIGANFPISYSPLLSQDSINSIIDHLADKTGQTAQTITFHSTIIENLTNEQYTKIINKNWQLG